MNLSILSLNICLGVFNKLTELEKWTNSLKPDLCFIQECEVTDVNLNSIKLKDYVLFTTNRKPKARLCVFVNSLKLRQLKIKIDDSTETIIIKTEKSQVVGFYRPFKLTQHQNPKAYMDDVIKFLKTNLESDYETIIIGDFNLDYSKVADQSYNQRNIFDLWLDFVDSIGLSQIVNTPTWSRCIGNVIKSSILDHCYTNLEIHLNAFDTLLSDHKGLFISTSKNLKKNFSSSIKRNWKHYSPIALTDSLSNVNWERFVFMDLEQMADYLDIELLSALHKLAPERIIKPKERYIAWSEKLLDLKRKKNNLIKRNKKLKSTTLARRAKELDKAFRNAICEEKRSKIRNTVNYGNPNSMWDAIKLAEGKFGFDEIPGDLHNGGKPFINTNSAEVFAKFFQDKIKMLKSTITKSVTENGSKLFEHTYSSPFTIEKITEAAGQMKRKNSYGHDRVPMRVLLDSMPKTGTTICDLFKKIEENGEIPDKWKYGRVIPLHKKSDKSDVNNYRPISNICSTAKLFEKCLLLEIQRLESEHNISLTGNNQHGFKKDRSTITLGLQIQDEIADNLENNAYVGLISIDLSAAFDTICKQKMVERLRATGLNQKFVDLIKSWLSERYSYVECNGSTSFPYKEEWGTPQGSVLGPTLFAIYMRPLMEICKDVKMYADDNYFIEKHVSLQGLKQRLESKLTKATDWLEKSDLVINYKKTEFVVFTCGKPVEMSIQLKQNEIKNSKVINVLGVTFDENLKWSYQIDKVIQNAKKDCYRLKSLRMFFSDDEMSKILTCLIFARFYYGSAIWLNPFVNKRDKNRLLSTSSYLIKSAFNLTDWTLVSRKDIHSLCNRATPEKMSQYCSAITLFNILNSNFPDNIYHELQCNVLSNDRTGLFYFPDKSRKRVALNRFSNRVSFISKRLTPNWPSLSKYQFKKAAKLSFLS